MNKKEVTEIKKQFTPSNCAITRICGCYVDGEKEKKMEMKTELKRSKLMAKAMKINKKAGIITDIQNNSEVNAESITNNEVNVKNIANNEVNEENINDKERIKPIEKPGCIENENIAGNTGQIENINNIESKNPRKNIDNNEKHRDNAPEEENLDNPVEYIEQNNIISITKERKIE